jgi:hypothetical protein
MCHIANRWRKTAAGVTIFTRPQSVLLAHEYATACNRVLSLLFFFAFANQNWYKAFRYETKFSGGTPVRRELTLWQAQEKDFVVYLSVHVLCRFMRHLVTDDQGFGG